MLTPNIPSSSGRRRGPPPPGGGKTSIGVLALALLGLPLPALPQVSLDAPLDQRSAARLDRMEKAMREIRAIVFQGRETGQPVVVQPAETQGQLNAMTDRLNDLDRTVSRLNGQLEIIRHDLDQARQDATDLRSRNDDLHGQIDGLNAKIAAMAMPPPPPPAADPAQGNPPPADPAAAYAAARHSLLSGDAVGAENGFRDYAGRFGDTPQAPEANYFLGRLLLARQAWADAASAEIAAIRGWPKTRWAPEAVLDLSRALVGLGKPADACQTLGELPKRYPAISPTQKAAAATIRVQARCG